MLQILKRPELFDAIVIGSGATGGWAAKKLTEAGMQVVLLEAGETTVESDFTEYNGAREPRFSRPTPEISAQRPIQVSCYACRKSKYKWFVNDFENPYTQVKPYRWIRMRVLGGRLLAWERQCYRMSDLDFKAASRDGYGDDWPISYQDLVPYYEEVERYIGVTGIPEHLSQVPDSIFSPIATTRTNFSSAILRDSIREKFGRVVTPSRLAVMTHAQNKSQRCFYWTKSLTGRFELSHFSSPWTALSDAASTGRLTMVTNAVASKILMNGGKAIGVVYVDRLTGASQQIRSRIVVLCASTLESTRLLLNSDICNSSGKLGRYLMDHVFGGGAIGTIEVKINEISADSYQRHRVYIPRFRNLTEIATNNFIRGYGFQGESFLDNEAQNGREGSSHGRAGRYKVRLRSYCECLAREGNFVEIDRSYTDKWGIPILKITADWCDNDLGLWRDACAQAADMLEAIGAAHVRMPQQLSLPGLCVHEVGTARMGKNPKTSVVNRYCQTHDVPNIFVTDGACWVSSGCQNPTLTMMAITVRTCDYIVREYSKQMQ